MGPRRGRALALICGQGPAAGKHDKIIQFDYTRKIPERNACDPFWPAQKGKAARGGGMAAGRPLGFNF